MATWFLGFFADWICEYADVPKCPRAFKLNMLKESSGQFPEQTQRVDTNQIADNKLLAKISPNLMKFYKSIGFPVHLQSMFSLMKVTEIELLSLFGEQEIKVFEDEMRAGTFASGMWNINTNLIKTILYKSQAFDTHTYFEI